MAKNYTRPLAEVYQLLEVTQQATGDHLSACIVGPEYDVYRYGIEDDVHGETYIGGHKPESGPWVADPTNIALRYAMDAMFDYTVDEASLKVYADGIEVAILNQGTAKHWTKKEGTKHVLIYDGNTTPGDTVFHRAPAAGDIIYILGADGDWNTAVTNTVVSYDLASKELTLEDPVLTLGVDASGKGSITIYSKYSGYIDKISKKQE